MWSGPALFFGFSFPAMSIIMSALTWANTKVSLCGALRKSLKEELVGPMEFASSGPIPAKKELNTLL